MLRGLLKLFALLAACAISACSMVPDRDPDVRGVITRVQTVGAEGEQLGAILVEENPSDSSGSAKDYVTITTATRIFTAQGNERHRASFDELRYGRRVEAWYTGPVAESYPRQARARVIVMREP